MAANRERPVGLQKSCLFSLQGDESFLEVEVARPETRQGRRRRRRENGGKLTVQALSTD
jgi:hypothetical protein